MKSRWGLSKVYGRGLGIRWTYARGWFTVGRRWGWQYRKGQFS